MRVRLWCWRRLKDLCRLRMKRLRHTSTRLKSLEAAIAISRRRRLAEKKGRFESNRLLKRMNFWQFLQQNYPELLTLIRQHLALVFASIAIAVFIGVPTGIALTRYASLRSPILGLANIM